MTPEEMADKAYELEDRYSKALMRFDISGIPEDAIRMMNFYTLLWPINYKNSFSFDCKKLEEGEVSSVPAGKLYLSTWLHFALVHGFCIIQESRFSIINFALENPPPVQAREEFNKVLSEFGNQDIVIAFWVKLVKKRFFGLCLERRENTGYSCCVINFSSSIRASTIFRRARARLGERTGFNTEGA